MKNYRLSTPASTKLCPTRLKIVIIHGYPLSLRAVHQIDHAYIKVYQHTVAQRRGMGFGFGGGIEFIEIIEIVKQQKNYHHLSTTHRTNNPKE